MATMSDRKSLKERSEGETVIKREDDSERKRWGKRSMARDEERARARESRGNRERARKRER